MSGGADKWNYEVNAAVVFGMYPELDSASKEFDHRYKEIFSEFQNSPNKDRENLSKQLKTLSLEIGKEYGLSEGYYFNKITEAQLQRVTQRKSAAIKNACSKDAEAHVDPLHIVMQGLIKKVSANDCIDLMQDFQLAETFFEHDKKNNFEIIEKFQPEFPEAHSIYKQVKKSLETAGIKDCYQKIDSSNYKKFAQTLGNFEYKGKKYDLLDVVQPITQRRDMMGRIKENRANSH